jgi:pimeloyl-ACP methyl ester carboxylesterase
VPYASVNELNMYYEVHGEDPSPLLLLHGGTGSIPEKWIPFFSPSFQVTAMEQMGHGQTADLVDRPFHYHNMAEDTVELMSQLGIESAVVVGYSDGGIIDLDMAIHHPDRVTKLAVTGAESRVDGYTEENKEWARTFDPTDQPVSDGYVLDPRIGHGGNLASSTGYGLSLSFRGRYSSLRIGDPVLSDTSVSRWPPLTKSRYGSTAATLCLGILSAATCIRVEPENRVFRPS